MGMEEETNFKRFSCRSFKNLFYSSIRKAFKKGSSTSNERKEETNKELVNVQIERHNSDNYDYVQEDNVDKISSDSISLYQCEMPAERIRKLRAKKDSMSRLKDLPLGIKSCYPAVDTRKPRFVDYESITRRPVLVSAEVFARSRNNNNNNDDKLLSNDDYLTMDDPPNYDDFMYLRWQENTPPSGKGTPPPPYTDMNSNHSYINMV